MAVLVQTVLNGPSTPDVLRLDNLGFETQDWECILQILLEKNCASLTDLSLKENAELWDPDSGCLIMTKQLLSMQEQIRALDLGYECPYTEILEDEGLPEFVRQMLSITPAAIEAMRVQRSKIRMAQCQNFHL